MAERTGSRVFLAFRFHVNFYHSYRGDSVDENGVGKDIRVIRSVLDDLDRLNDQGVPVCGTWDIENFYSLQTYMPRHAPDLIERIQRRVDDGRDEIEVMSYNNGIITAHSQEEFDQAIEWAVSNPDGSGLEDLFGTPAPIVRPQECMMTPAHLRRYPRHGITAVSLFYSALPFNGFSTFVSPLPFLWRYNPLTLKSGDTSGSMTLIPAYNHGDIADHWASIRRWVRTMRKVQLGMEQPSDLLLLIDMDADDDFWAGIRIPFVRTGFASFAGLYRLVRSVAGLPYVAFARPHDYLEDHEPVGELTIGEDTADGSFDGYASWAEKWSNTAVWSRIHRGRIRAEAAREVGGTGSQDLGRLVAEARTARLRAMSTTHFGLASPVMNADRLDDAFAWSRLAESAGSKALAAARSGLRLRKGRCVLVFDPACGTANHGYGALVTVDAGELPSDADGLDDGDGASIPVVRRTRFGEPVRQLLVTAGPTVRRCRVRRGGVDAPPSRGAEGSGTAGLSVQENTVHGGGLLLRVAEDGGAEILAGADAVLAHPLAPPWVRYGGRVLPSEDVRTTLETVPGPPTEGGAGSGLLAAGFLQTGRIPLPGGQQAVWQRELLLVDGLPYVYVDVAISYPNTPHRRFDQRKARRLGRSWDGRWEEVAPCEIVPVTGATEEKPARVWKHNFLHEVSSYRLDYHRWSTNRDLDSVNNHVTDGWCAVVGPERGLLVAQSAAYDTSFAFCPLRTRIRDGSQDVYLNPFGTYAGRQRDYPTAVTGLGRRMALVMADQLDSYAPSYAGKRTRCALMLAPFVGDAPPESCRQDALLFATPPRVLASRST